MPAWNLSINLENFWRSTLHIWFKEILKVKDGGQRSNQFHDTLILQRIITILYSVSFTDIVYSFIYRYTSGFQVLVRWYLRWLVPKGRTSCTWVTTSLETFYVPRNSGDGELSWWCLNSPLRSMCGQTRRNCSTKSKPWNKPWAISTSKFPGRRIKNCLDVKGTLSRSIVEGFLFTLAHLNNVFTILQSSFLESVGL